MKPIPSIKALEEIFPAKGVALKRLLTSAAAVRAHPAAVALAASCYSPPTLAHMRMVALNSEAETYGVEACFKRGDDTAPAFEYLNTGDRYAPTIVRFRSGAYALKSWGDIVERWPLGAQS